VGVTFNPPLAEVLLYAGANPNDGESLYHACETGGVGNTEHLQLLYDHGLDRDALGFCVKHAVDYLDHGKVEWFLEHGADPNADPLRSCLGHAIVRRSSASLLERILDAGGDPDARWNGEMPLISLAARLADPVAHDLLASRGAVGDLDELDAWMLALGRGDGDAVRAGAHLVDLLPLDDDTTGFTLAGTGVLSQLASGGCTASVRLALDVGWDVNAPGWMMGTPLHHAALRGREETVALLLERGAHVHPEAAGETPVQWARWGVGLPEELTGDYTRTFALLLEAGADGSAVRPTGVPEVDQLLERAAT
ncbi:MAG: ankyrin repeat domain-containing protein, partial [Planctomycetota bacterium]|jgi:ankyrin repeat protein